MKKVRPTFVLISVWILAVLLVITVPITALYIASPYLENPNTAFDLKQVLFSSIPPLVLLALLVGLWDMKRWVIPLVLVVSAYFWYQAISIILQPTPGAEGLKLLSLFSMFPFLLAFTVAPICVIKNRNLFN